MSWSDHHSASEIFAADAEFQLRAGSKSIALDLYHRAAEEEARAFEALEVSKTRTRGITAVSAVALCYKAQTYQTAEQWAYRYLASRDLPGFAVNQLRGLLQMAWTANSAREAGVSFVPGDVLVSVKGGQVIHGGAPLDLIIRKVEGIQAVLFRTVEMLLNRPFRKRGGPDPHLQSMFTPWLFQAPAGSYQFAVRMQEPAQQELFAQERPTVDRVTQTFFRVLRASAVAPELDLPNVVPDADYRGAFLNLARNLAPVGRTFGTLEVRDPSSPEETLVRFAPETRKELNGALRKLRPIEAKNKDEEAFQVEGVLRAVHLDNDWLEVTTPDDPPQHVRIDEAGDILDDVIGPMVNRRVLVTAVKRGAKNVYRDIEPVE